MSTPEQSLPEATPSLFREQVVPRSHEGLGDVVRWRLLHPSLTALGLLLLVLGSVGLVLQLEYAEKVSASGAVRSHVQPVVVRSPGTGVVTRVAVGAGQEVARHQLLLVMDQDLRGASGISHRALQIQQLQELERSATAERDAALQRLQVQHAGMQAQRTSLQAQLRSAAAAHDLLGQRKQLLQEAYGRQQQLAVNGWISAQEAAGSRIQVLDAQARFLQQQAAVQDLRRQAAGLDAQLDNLRQQRQVERRRFDTRLQELRGRIREQRQSSVLSVLAPASGKIVDLAMHPGMRVNTEDTLMSIAPPGVQRHDVDLLLTSRAAGRVRPGMSVRLRYHGYPHQDFGAAEGVIVSVSDVPRVHAGQPAFRAVVRVDHLPAAIDHVPEGMTVQADIVLRSKPLAAWLLDPVRAAVERL